MGSWLGLTRRQSLQAGRRELDVVAGAGAAFADDGRLDGCVGGRVRDGDGAVAGGFAGG